MASSFFWYLIVIGAVLTAWMICLVVSVRPRRTPAAIGLMLLYWGLAALVEQSPPPLLAPADTVLLTWLLLFGLLMPFSITGLIEWKGEYP